MPGERMIEYEAQAQLQKMIPEGRGKAGMK
jgi:hypothetical protein